VKKTRFQTSDWLMMIAVMIWGLNYSLVKVALAEIPPLPYNGIRLLLTSAVLILWLRLSGENLEVKKEHLGKIVLLSISGHTIYQCLFIFGIHHTTASNTAVLFGSAPILISIFSSFFKHERIKPVGWFGIVLAFTGVYLVISGKSGGFSLHSATLKGDILVLLAVLLWAHYTVSSRPLLKVYSPLKFTALTMGLGSLLFFPFSVPSLMVLPYAQISFKAWACLVYSGVGALAVGLIIWFYSVQRVGNSQTAIYSNLSPLMAVVFAHLVLSESIPASLLGGVAIILLGIFLTRRGREIIDG